MDDDCIVIDPNICHGKPVIRGTRMAVAWVLGSLGGGMSVEDIRAALRFAGRLVEREQFHPLPH